MDPCEQMDDLTGLLAVINTEVAALVTEIDNVGPQWDRLKALAGPRDDHAQALLKAIAYRLDRIAKVANRCRVQAEGGAK